MVEAPKDEGVRLLILRGVRMVLDSGIVQVPVHSCPIMFVFKLKGGGVARVLRRNVPASVYPLGKYSASDGPLTYRG